MQRKPLMAIGVLGLAAVALYVGATLLGSVLDAAVASINTDVMGLFERITIGVFMVWLTVVSAYSLMEARTAVAASPATTTA
jgi:hypothetical protein